MTDKKPIPMPAAGGSYTRDTKGELKQVDGPDLSKAKTPKSKGNSAKDNAPVKEA